MAIKPKVKKTSERKPLIIGVKRDVWRMNDGSRSKSDREFAKAKKKIVKKKCTYCGFTPPEDMRFLLDLHHYDDNHENNSPSNLLPVCVPCHMTHHIGMAGIKRLGILSWIPEWPQEKVNSISILALASNHLDKYVDRYSDSINDNARKKINKLRSAMQNAAKIYRSFISRSEYLSSTISGDEAQLSDPVVLSNIMLAMSDEEYRNRASLLPVLSGIRLVPMRDGYEENERCGYKNMADAWAHALFRMATGIPSKSS